jgi:hypothetical protein
MRINDFLNTEESSYKKELSFIKNICSQFIQESRGLPLYKLLPSSYANLQKVKVRIRKNNNLISEVFDSAFVSNNLRNRAIYCYGAPQTPKNNLDLFYIFPINNFRYMYNKEIQNSSENYKKLIDKLVENLSDEEQPIEIVSDLVKYTYCKSNLVEGIASNSEIIIYGIPYYYVVRCSSVPNYQYILY